jgi:hypothetical protein
MMVEVEMPEGDAKLYPVATIDKFKGVSLDSE